MKVWDIALMAVESLNERKFRFALNLIGILIGCAAVMGLVSLTQGLGNEISSQLEVFGPQNVIVIPGEMGQGIGLASGTLGWRDLDIVSKVPDVTLATPIIANKIARYNVRGTPHVAGLYGVTNDYFTINKNTEVEEGGRLLLRTDTSAMIIGANVAQPQGEEEPILNVGDRLKIEAIVGGETRTMTFRVVGVLKRTGGGGGFGGGFGSNLDDSVAIPLRTAQQLYDVGGEFDFIMASAVSLDKVDDVEAEIEARLGDTVTVISFESVQKLVGQVLGSIEAVLGGIAGISLLVAGIGIINTMTISVMERTREIGVLKAIGAKSRDVLLMFLSEALLTGLVGGSLGAILGVGLSKLVGNFINLPAAPSIGLGVIVVGFAIVTSSASGLYPAWRASNLSPVEALRSE